MRKIALILASWTCFGAWGLPGFVDALKRIHPELSPNCATCHDTGAGERPSIGNINESARPFYREILRAQQPPEGSLPPDSSSPAVAPPDPPADFMVFGDTRDNPSVHGKIVARLCAAKPKAVFHTGDIVANGGSPRLWEEALRIEDCLISSKLLQPSCGNHEGSKCVDNPLRKALGNTKKYYTVDVGEFTFIALDSNAPSGEQLKWLDSLPTGKNYIPFFHHPAYPTMSGHGADSAVIRDFVPRFKNRGVKLVLNGHNHGYDRAVVDGVQWVTSGGGGAPLYPCGSPRPYTQACASEHHYLVCSARDHRISCVAKTPEGKALDSFTVSFP